MLAHLTGYDNRISRAERDANLLKWIVGATIAIQLGIAWMQLQALDGISGIEARLSAIEVRLASLSASLDTP